jgi:hypothetical protein
MVGLDWCSRAFMADGACFLTVCFSGLLACSASPLRHLPYFPCVFGSPRSALYTRLAALVKLSTSEWRHAMGVPTLSGHTLIRLESLHVTWCNAGPWSKRLLRVCPDTLPVVIVESQAIDTNDRLGYAHVETSTVVTGTVNQTLHGDATTIQGPKLTSGRASSSSCPHRRYALQRRSTTRPVALPCPTTYCSRRIGVFMLSRVQTRVTFKICLCSSRYPCRAWVGSRGMSAPVDHRYLQ